MEYINQENHGKSIVRHHGNEVVDGCDERTGSHSRINVNFMEKHGNYSAHKAGNNHRYNERNADTAGQQEGLSPIIHFKKVDIDAERYQRQNSQQCAVDETHTHFLAQQT